MAVPEATILSAGLYASAKAVGPNTAVDVDVSFAACESASSCPSSVLQASLLSVKGLNFSSVCASANKSPPIGIIIGVLVGVLLVISASVAGLVVAKKRKARLGVGNGKAVVETTKNTTEITGIDVVTKVRVTFRVFLGEWAVTGSCPLSLLVRVPLALAVHK